MVWPNHYKLLNKQLAAKEWLGSLMEIDRDKPLQHKIVYCCIVVQSKSYVHRILLSLFTFFSNRFFFPFFFSSNAKKQKTPLLLFLLVKVLQSAGPKNQPSPPQIKRATSNCTRVGSRCHRIPQFPQPTRLASGTNQDCPFSSGSASIASSWWLWPRYKHTQSTKGWIQRRSTSGRGFPGWICVLPLKPEWIPRTPATLFFLNSEFLFCFVLFCFFGEFGQTFNKQDEKMLKGGGLDVSPMIEMMMRFMYPTESSFCSSRKSNHNFWCWWSVKTKARFSNSIINSWIFHSSTF